MSAEETNPKDERPVLRIGWVDYYEVGRVEVNLDPPEEEQQKPQAEEKEPPKMNPIDKIKLARQDQQSELAEAAIVNFLQPDYEAIEPYLQFGTGNTTFIIQIPHHRTIIGKVEYSLPDALIPRVNSVDVIFFFWTSNQRFKNIADALIAAEKRSYRRKIARDSQRMSDAFMREMANEYPLPQMPGFSVPSPQLKTLIGNNLQNPTTESEETKPEERD